MHIIHRRAVVPAARPNYEAGLPSLPDYSGASALFPKLALPFDALAPFLFQTAALLTLSAASARFAGHPVYGSIVGFAILAMGVFVVPAERIRSSRPQSTERTSLGSEYR